MHYTTGDPQEAARLIRTGLKPLQSGGGWWVFEYEQVTGETTGLWAHKALPVVLIEDIKQAWELARRGGDYLGTTPGGAYIFRAKE